MGSGGLGGFRSQNPKPFANRPQFPRGPIYRLFPDATPAELTAGKTIYRGIFIEAQLAVASCKVYINGASTANGTGIAIGKDPAGANQTSGFISAETSAPSGVAFTSPVNIGTAIDLGALAAGESRLLWIRQTIGAASPACQNESFIMLVQSDAELDRVVFFWHQKAGVKFGTLSKSTQGEVATPQWGTTWTIPVVDLATGLTPTDPGKNQVFIFIAGTTANAGDWATNTTQPLLGQLLVDVARKTGTGAYTYCFQGLPPGQYDVTFDIGEDTAHDTVWFSAVG